MKAVRRVFANPAALHSGWKVLSSDLTTASDLIPLDLVKALVEGLCAGADVPDWFREALLAATGPQLLTWPNGH